MGSGNNESSSPITARPIFWHILSPSRLSNNWAEVVSARDSGLQEGRDRGRGKSGRRCSCSNILVKFNHPHPDYEGELAASILPARKGEKWRQSDRQANGRGRVDQSTDSRTNEQTATGRDADDDRITLEQVMTWVA